MPALLLFSYDLAQLAYLPQVDPSHHIKIDSPIGTPARVVKNGISIRNLLQEANKLGIPCVCYSNKSHRLISPILKAISPETKWTYFVVDPQKCPYLGPNYARLEHLGDGDTGVVYGEHLAECEGREELRIALCAGYRMGLEESKRRVIIYEGIPEELARLKESGYQHVCSTVDTEQSLAHLRQSLALIATKTLSPAPEFLDLTSACPDLPPAHPPHLFDAPLHPCPAVALTNPPPAPRHPRSLAICSMLFRHPGDKQIYLGESDLPHKLGNQLYQQHQQNRCLLPALLQTLASFATHPYLCIPTYTSTFSMRNCLIRGYHKNKASFVVRPYYRELQSAAEGLGEDEARELFMEGRYRGGEVRGMGVVLAVGLLCGEGWGGGWLEGVAMVPGQAQTKASKGGKDKGMSKEGGEQLEDCYYCCKISTHSCFPSNPQPLPAQLPLLPSLCVPLQQAHPRVQAQLAQTLHHIYSHMTLFTTTFNHSLWKYNKTSQLSQFTHNLQTLYRLYHPQVQVFRPVMSISHVEKLVPQFMDYLVAGRQEYGHFTKVERQGGGEYSFFGFEYESGSEYQRLLKQSDNFIIYGQCVPVISLMGWIKSQHPATEVKYVSLLHSNRENYERQLKITKADKKPTIFIVDYCETEGQIQQGKTIADLNWGIKSIFIYRFRLGACRRLKVLHDQTIPLADSPVQKFALLHTKQQILSTIIAMMPETDMQGSMFTVYERALVMYLRNRWVRVGRAAGVPHVGVLKQKLKMLVQAITSRANRLVSVLNDAKFSSLQGCTAHGDGIQEQQLSLYPQPSLPSPLTTASCSVLPILYCLPIRIQQQRLLLIADLVPFLHCYYLHHQILSLSWRGDLQGQQLEHFVQWYPHLPQPLKIQHALLRILQILSIEELTTKDAMGGGVGDCLELMRAIGMKQCFCPMERMLYCEGAVERVHGRLVQCRDGGLYALGLGQAQVRWERCEGAVEMEGWITLGAQEDGEEQRMYYGQAGESGEVRIQGSQLVLREVVVMGNKIKDTTIKRVQLPKQWPISKINRLYVIDMSLWVIQSGSKLVLCRVALTENQYSITSTTLLAQNMPPRVHLNHSYHTHPLSATLAIIYPVAPTTAHLHLYSITPACLSQLTSTTITPALPIKCIGSSFAPVISQQMKPKLEVLIFQEVTDCLQLYQVEQEARPVRRWYRVEPEPVHVAKMGGRLLVFSRHGFGKVMTIQQE